MLSLAFKLDEKTKKIILVLCALFILLLLILGAIYYFISKYMEKEERKMDDYMYDLIKYKIVKKEEDFTKCVNYYETRSLFTNAKWGYRGIILSTIIALLIAIIFFNKNIKGMFGDFFNWFPVIKWETVGSINKALGYKSLSGPKWFPASPFPTIRMKDSLNFKDFIFYVSTMYYIVIIICMVNVSKAILGYIARTKRAKKVVRKVFEKSLDKLDGVKIDEI